MINKSLFGSLLVLLIVVIIFFFLYENNKSYQDKQRLTQYPRYCEYNSDCKVVKGCCGPAARNKFYEHKKMDCRIVDCGTIDHTTSRKAKCQDNACILK